MLMDLRLLDIRIAEAKVVEGASALQASTELISKYPELGEIDVRTAMSHPLYRLALYTLEQSGRLSTEERVRLEQAK